MAARWDAGVKESTWRPACKGCLLASFWFPFVSLGSLLVQFGTLLAPFGFLLRVGFLLAPFGSLLAPFGFPQALFLVSLAPLAPRLAWPRSGSLLFMQALCNEGTI